MQAGSLHVNVFQSAAIYCDRLSGDDTATRTIAFVCDRLPTRGCFPVVLKPQKPWTWPRLAIDMDKQAFAKFYSKEVNRLQWWQPTGLKTTKQMPTILSVPLALADFLVAEQRTPWELYKEVHRLVQSPETGVEASMMELVCLWTMAASQLNDGNRSPLSMDVDPVLSFDPLFL